MVLRAEHKMVFDAVFAVRFSLIFEHTTNLEKIMNDSRKYKLYCIV